MLNDERCEHLPVHATLNVMTTKTAVVGRFALAGIALVMACSDPGTAAPDAASDARSDGQLVGRGSAACNEWQSAYCGLLVKCQSPNANALCEQVRGISCKSDTDATQCADLINATGCAAPPAVCDVGGIADPAPAKKACEDFNAAFCERFDECQPGSLATCLAEVKMSLNCDTIIGISAGFEACMSQIPQMACSNPMLPEVCRGVLLAGQ